MAIDEPAKLKIIAGLMIHAFYFNSLARIYEYTIQSAVAPSLLPLLLKTTLVQQWVMVLSFISSSPDSSSNPIFEIYFTHTVLCTHKLCRFSRFTS